MRRFYEWKSRVTTGNSTSSSTAKHSTNTSGLSYKERLRKLFTYHMNKAQQTSSASQGSGIVYSNTQIEYLNETTNLVSIIYSEQEHNQKTGVDRKRTHIATYDKNINSWVYAFFFDEQLAIKEDGTSGFNELLNVITQRIYYPARSTSEAQQIWESIDSSILTDITDYENLWEADSAKNIPLTDVNIF